MLVYRLCKKKYSGSLSGSGAASAGGRWNSKGTEIIYTSESRALAMLECFVHLPFDTIPRDYVIISIKVPEAVNLNTIDTKTLPGNWRDNAGTTETGKIGDDFVRLNAACVLQVPSAVVPGDRNYLINPNHPDFSMIRIETVDSLPFDERLFQQRD